MKYIFDLFSFRVMRVLVIFSFVYGCGHEYAKVRIDVEPPSKVLIGEYFSISVNFKEIVGNDLVLHSRIGEVFNIRIRDNLCGKPKFYLTDRNSPTINYEEGTEDLYMEIKSLLYEREGKYYFVVDNESYGCISAKDDSIYITVAVYAAISDWGLSSGDALDQVEFKMPILK